jgi:hypothetical protein
VPVADLRVPGADLKGELTMFNTVCPFTQHEVSKGYRSFFAVRRPVCIIISYFFDGLESVRSVCIIDCVKRALLFLFVGSGLLCPTPRSRRDVAREREGQRREK